MAIIKIRGPVDLEKLYDVCAGVSATVALRAEQNEITLSLVGADAAGCAELLDDWLRLEGIEVASKIG